MKLHPGIVYSHPASAVCYPPKLDLVMSARECKGVALRFALQQGQYDWNYPFDLCASMYRVAQVKQLLLAITGSIRNPNMFEVEGCAAFWRLRQQPSEPASSSAPPLGPSVRSPHTSLLDTSLVHLDSFHRFNYCYCSIKCAAVVLTINRVQNTFATPLFRVSDASLESLNALVAAGASRQRVIETGSMASASCKNFDLEEYAHREFCLSAHIGHVLLETEDPVVSMSMSVPASVSAASTVGSKQVGRTRGGGFRGGHLGCYVRAMLEPLPIC